MWCLCSKIYFYIFLLELGIPPDFTRLQFDESCGYYFDPVSFLYYDSNTQYFYDSTKLEFLYWDSEKSEYISVPHAPSTTTAAVSSKKKKSERQKLPKTEDKQIKDDKDKPDRVKVAKKIAQVRTFIRLYAFPYSYI